MKKVKYRIAVVWAFMLTIILSACSGNSVMPTENNITRKLRS